MKTEAPANTPQKLRKAGILLIATTLASTGEAPADEDLGHGYVRKGAHIHFEGGGETGPASTRIDQASRGTVEEFSRALGRKVRPCTSPDAESFEALSEEYSRDRNAVYYKWISPGRFSVVELPQADVTTFKPMNFAHAVDGNSIWYLDRPIQNSDPATAVLIADRIVKDSRHVYISGETQRHLDAATFRHLGSAYYADAGGIYWGKEPVRGADPGTFEVLTDSFVAKDLNRVYRSGRPLPGIDPGTCKVLLHDPYGYQVITDKNGVYLNNLRFLHADPKDFEMIDNLTGKGGNHVFLVELPYVTPATISREGDRLIVETVLYSPNTAEPLAVLEAEVSDDSLKGIAFSPAPGKTAADPVPEWQINILKQPALIERMKSAGELLQ